MAKNLLNCTKKKEKMTENKHTPVILHEGRLYLVSEVYGKGFSEEDQIIAIGLQGQKCESPGTKIDDRY